VGDVFQPKLGEIRQRGVFEFMRLLLFVVYLMGNFCTLNSLGFGRANSSWLLDKHWKDASGEGRQAEDEHGDGLLDGWDNRSYWGKGTRYEVWGAKDASRSLDLENLWAASVGKVVAARLANLREEEEHWEQYWVLVLQAVEKNGHAA